MVCIFGQLPILKALQREEVKWDKMNIQISLLAVPLDRAEVTVIVDFQVPIQLNQTSKSPYSLYSQNEWCPHSQAANHLRPHGGALFLGSDFYWLGQLPFLSWFTDWRWTSTVKELDHLKHGGSRFGDISMYLCFSCEGSDASKVCFMIFQATVRAFRLGCQGVFSWSGKMSCGVSVARTGCEDLL